MVKIYDYEDEDTCWQCGGEGGWPSCMEDTCPSTFGEENCRRAECWRDCDVCGGSGYLVIGDEDPTNGKEA